MMKTTLIKQLTHDFESLARHTDSGVEFWLARDIQQGLGYTEWRNFNTVIAKAKTACEGSGHAVLDHFVDVNKMVGLGSGSQREIDDIMLSRGITPENLPPAEDVKKVERRLSASEKRALQKPEKIKRLTSAQKPKP